MAGKTRAKQDEELLAFVKSLGLTKPEITRILQGKSRTPKVISKHITRKKYQVGVVSDTHFGSLDEKVNELHTLYSIFKKKGVKEVLHAGDILQGQRMYPGWEMEVSHFGSKNQIAHCVEVYPKMKGIKTYFITGTHDTCYYKQNGTEVGELIAEKRDDLVYLGQYQGDVIVNGISFRLVHPTGGVPYALSYRGQKIAEQIPSGEKPHILLIGHLHVSYYFPYRLMHVFGCGAFQGQTPYLLQKGLNPNVGGWLLTIRHAQYKKRSVVAIEPNWIPFFD